MGLGGHNACVLIGRVGLSYIVNEDVERYAEARSTPDPELFRRLEEETPRRRTFRR